MKETINKIFSLFLAGQKIKAMEFALNSNLFDFLKDKSANFGDITEFLKSDAENTLHKFRKYLRCTTSGW